MDENETDYEADELDTERDCWRCGGEGYGIVGCDWDPEDAINGPYPGEIEQCSCCHGTGKASDCWYW